jgi:hypothetical protein
MIMLENLYRRPRLIWYNSVLPDGFYFTQVSKEFDKVVMRISASEDIARTCQSKFFNCTRYFPRIWETLSTEWRRRQFLSDNTLIKTYNTLMSQL